MDKSISICVLNWNGKYFLLKLIPSLLKHCPNYEIVVIDNNSCDGSKDYISKNFPEKITLICLDKNYGFAEGYNKGLDQIESDYCITLNNDVYVDSDFIFPLLKHLKSPDVFAVGSKIISWDKKYIDSAGIFFPFLGIPLDRGKNEPAYKYTTQQEVFSVCAGAMGFSLRKFKEIGGFRKEFFSYLEDTDLCHRARISGFKNIYEPRSIVYHYYGGSSKKFSNYKLFLILRNSLAWQIINFEKKNLFPALLAALLLRIGIFSLYLIVNQSKARSVLKSFISIIHWRDYLIRERCKIQTMRKQKDRIVFKHRNNPISEIIQILKQI